MTASEKIKSKRQKMSVLRLLILTLFFLCVLCASVVIKKEWDITCWRAATTPLYVRWAFQVFGALCSLKAKAFPPRRHRGHGEDQKQKVTIQLVDNLSRNELQLVICAEGATFFKWLRHLIVSWSSLLPKLAVKMNFNVIYPQNQQLCWMVTAKEWF